MLIIDIEKLLEIFKNTNNPQNLIGEHLRYTIFSKSGFGCYSTFDIETSFHQVSIEEMTKKMPLIVEVIKKEGWFYENNSWSSMPQCYLSEDEKIAMVYAWTNDGYLSYSWKNHFEETVIYNTDCKKSRWHFSSNKA